MSIEELLSEHRNTAHVARKWGEDALHVWYADLGVEVEGERVNYYCPGCGSTQASTIHEFVYFETNDAMICGTCRGDVEDRAGALD